MKIVIENTTFGFDEGCRLLKLKHETSPFSQLDDIWDDIKPMTFKEIAEMDNLEHRRVGILCLGLERLAKEIKPILIDTQTIGKETNFIDRNGNLVNQKFNDTYELYQVKGETLGGKSRWGRSAEDSYFVKFKDTSTDREYMIWVEPKSVWNANYPKGEWFYDMERTPINAIQSIAWTMQTTVPKGNIKEILRQGDCILVKPKDSTKPLLDTPRHLTEIEYRKLLTAES